MAEVDNTRMNPNSENKEKNKDSKKILEMLKMLMNENEQVIMACLGYTKALTTTLDKLFPEEKRKKGSVPENLLLKMYQKVHDNNFTNVPIVFDESMQDKINYLIPFPINPENPADTLKMINEIYYVLLTDVINAFSTNKAKNDSFTFNILSLSDTNYYVETVSDLMMTCSAVCVLSEKEILKMNNTSNNTLAVYFPPLIYNANRENPNQVMKYYTGSSPWTTCDATYEDGPWKVIKHNLIGPSSIIKNIKEMRHMHMVLNEDNKRNLAFSSKKKICKNIIISIFATINEAYFSIDLDTFYEKDSSSEESVPLDKISPIPHVNSDFEDDDESTSEDGAESVETSTNKSEQKEVNTIHSMLQKLSPIWNDVE